MPKANVDMEFSVEQAAIGLIRFLITCDDGKTFKVLYEGGYHLDISLGTLLKYYLINMSESLKSKEYSLHNFLEIKGQLSKEDVFYVALMVKDIIAANDRSKPDESSELIQTSLPGTEWI